MSAPLHRYPHYGDPQKVEEWQYPEYRTVRYGLNKLILVSTAVTGGGVPKLTNMRYVPQEVFLVSSTKRNDIFKLADFFTQGTQKLAKQIQQSASG